MRRHHPGSLTPLYSEVQCHESPHSTIPGLLIMPEEYRVTIRLTPEVYAQLQARGSQGQPLAAVVRHALVDYLARQPEAPASAEELALAAAAVAARLDGLQVQ